MEKIDNGKPKIDTAWKYTGCFLIFCLIHTFFIPEKYGDISQLLLSLVGGSGALIIFIMGCKNTEKSTPYRLSLVLAGFFYLLARSQSPRKADHYFYIFINLSLGFAVYQLIREHWRKWNKARILIDGFFIGGVFCFAVWQFFLLPLFSQYLKNGFALSEIAVDSIYILTTLIIVFLLSIFYSLQKDYLYSINNRIQALGFFLWCAGNIACAYLGIEEGHEKGRFLDTMWPIALVLIGVSSMKKDEAGEEEEKRESQLSEVSLQDMNSFFILVMGVSLALVYYGDKEGLFVLVPLLIFRYFFSKHIDVYEKNGVLNMKYRETNDLLVQTNRQLYQMANQDALTGIYNRRRLIEELENLTRNSEHHEKFALIFVDLDGFKNINDTYGHDMGDFLLKESVERFRESAREMEFLARQGGDEFVIIFRDIRDRNHIMERCREIRDSMAREFLISGKRIRTSVSIGAAIYPQHARNYMDLIKCGDRALYKSKSAGKNQFHIYDEELQRLQERRFLLESRLQNARLRKELYVLYQPQIDLGTGELSGIEALLRWRNSELGEVSPKEFIPIAEEIGVIHSLGEFVLEKATRDIRYLNEKYGKNLKVGINVSPKQFFTEWFFFELRKNMGRNRVNPSWLDIEITENMAMDDEKEVIKRLKALSELGMSISIDDFGTGYSSLAYLKNYPVTTLKIAMELIRDLDRGKQDYNIVKAITAMCREMGIETVAEGVENSRHYNILKDFGCNRVQGYYISAPVKIQEIEERFLNEQKGDE